MNNCIFQLIIYVFNILTLLDGQMDKLIGIKMIAPTVKQLAWLQGGEEEEEY